MTRNSMRGGFSDFGLMTKTLPYPENEWLGSVAVRQKKKIFKFFFFFPLTISAHEETWINEKKKHFRHLDRLKSIIEFPESI